VTDLVVRNGDVLVGSRRLRANLAIRDGRIEAIADVSAPISSPETINAAGLTILPGVIDPHVHFRDPGFTYKETFSTGSAAAAFGGVTTVFDMPSTNPPVYDAGLLGDKRKLAERQSWVDFGLYGSLDHTNIGRAAELAAAGAVAFKVFMYDRHSSPPYGITDNYLLLKAFEEVAGTGLVVTVHAESNDIVKSLTRVAKENDRSDPLAHLESRPAISEAEAIQRALLLAETSGARLHIAHLSSNAGVDLVRRAKCRGVRVTAEVTPQHLLLDSRDYARIGSAVKMVPPIRYISDQQALWAGMLDGTIDMIATDHAPHTESEKSRPIMEAASGMVGVETSLPLMLTQVNSGRLSLSQYVRLASENPARVFGLYPRKGAIAIGSDADLVAVDLNRRWTIRSSELHSLSRVTPFDDWSVTGCAKYTIVRGNVVMAEGKLVGSPSGRMQVPS